MKLSHVVVGGAFAAALFAPSVAQAGVRLGLGGDYWVDRTGLFGVTLTAEGSVTHAIKIGGRFGALATTTPNDFGVPVDLSIRANLARGRMYVEGLAGPWVLFNNDDPIRAHAAFGFGIAGSGVQVGLEVGYLTPAPIAGLRVAFSI
jgi:hypothetical protein